MIEVANLSALRSFTGTVNQLCYVKGHTYVGDGGGGIFMWRTESVFTVGEYKNDNNGTIVDTGSAVGRWVRQFEGYVNVLYFGALGTSGDYTTEIQKAIDFAFLNSKSDVIKGSTVFIPSGSYKINTLMLKSGVSILGESNEKTILYTTDNHAADYMFKMEAGPVFLDITNLNISGRQTEAGCFLFEANSINTEPFHGGLWNSTFKNIQITGFKGHGIYLKGGSQNQALPNQFNIFENVRVGKQGHFTNSLKMEGQNGQHTFLNCTFDGFYNKENKLYARGHNVNISPNGDITAGIVSFINCTFQDADYGIYMNYAENINIDGCWFENLGVAVTLNGLEKNSCRDITIQNCRFANAAGFGSLEVSLENIKIGQCVSITKSFVNVYNNYVAVSDINGPYWHPDSSFLLALDNSEGGVNIAGNVFQDSRLCKTGGVMQVLNIINPNILDCGRNKLVFVTVPSESTNNQINRINSTINASETLFIRANQGSITFNTMDSGGTTGKNIFLNGRASLTLTNGQAATFIKVDNSVGNERATYQLVSIAN
ncbi:hypothetical protein [Flavobacterium lindanitolerans]|uniref:hypothetical protein n=1 Tax=Flavobacterium lindanitolerans TaxID=428988 RepID=UPI0031CDEE0F